MSNLHFVFLQGMPSPFFRRVASKLSAMGCKTTGINLCVGDSLFWRGQNTVNYRGKLSGWPTFVTDFFKKHGVTDIVLLGEQRSYHKLAVEIAKAQGIRITVTDFGYLRPDWITLEREGMSGNSRFPRGPQEILQLASQVSNADLTARYADSFWNMSFGDLFYSFSNVLFGWLYPHYRRSDKRPHPIIYFPAMGRQLLFAKAAQRRACKKQELLFAAQINYFVFPLQLEHDFQIVAYSPFDNLEDAIRKVIKSFAAHANSDAHLVVKMHPADPGFKNWEKIIIRYAKEFGIENRVHYFNGGNLDEMIRRSVGMVTVNSTSGVRALQLGSSVMTLGKAIYDVPGLTYQGKLDNYWIEAAKPDPELVDAFINAMAATIQIRGVFFNEPGLTAAVDAAVERLYNQTVGLSASSISCCRSK